MLTNRQIPISEEIIKILDREFNGQVRKNVSLADRTTIRVGGTARLYLVPMDVGVLQRLLHRLRDLAVPVLPLGGGANVVVADSGVTRAAVISLVEHIHDIAEPTISNNRVKVDVDSGVRLSSLLQFCQERGYGGLEFLAGIPGSAGGAVVMNAGAFGREFSDVLLKVITCDGQGNLQSWTREQLNSGYRRGGIPVGRLVVSVELQLKLEDPEKIGKQMLEYRQIRRQKQPHGVPSAGSVFKNPPGDYAGRLIEAAGCSGWCCGRAQVSRKHANFITTEPGATAADVFTLIARVKEQVRKSFSLVLEEEIIRFGDEYLSTGGAGEEESL
ncbi:MAG: UDP-N-acetylmuramate dehydrogenase [Deltaproteobacteria bacterium]|nr:UDP-N-acetylmuramate dehydrogenase [Candidatus Tharpellaceae bacterium]